MTTDEIMALTRGGVEEPLVDLNVLLDLVTDDPNWAGLMTRDAARYRAYSPGVVLIAPN
jgi:hypothetical protein